MAKAKRKAKLSQLEIDMDSMRSVVDDVALMRTFTPEERHELCNTLLFYQEKYRKIAGHYYIK